MSFNMGYIARIVVVLKDAKQAIPAAIAVSRAFSLYSLKTGEGAPSDRTILVTLAFPATDNASVDYAELQALSDNARLAACLFDTPTNYLHTDSYVAQAQDVAKAVGASIKVIQGTDLEKGGFGGLWGVGKASSHLPALAILTYEPPTAAQKTICLCGKGIVYDTGGLSIKGSTNMPGMKGDMGGSAAVLGAFAAICRLGAPHRVHALLCLAENSVSAVATRPDDILTMYSGKTVEVNNTDAEGRLVLADGVAYATQHLQPDVVLDIATLTGAQLICTGLRHAGLVCNDAATEASVVAAGHASGDLVFPMLYCPELLMKEFESVVADMKNSVKHRGNAQSSCAGHFIESHLKEGWQGKWIHVDIAGPSGMGERGTGFGVALLATLVRKFL